MKTIKAKQSMAGSYGFLTAGQTAEVTNKVADELEKAGLVEVEGEGTEDAPEEKTTGVTVTDNTNKEKRQILPKQEKNAEAGPGTESKTAPAKGKTDK